MRTLAAAFRTAALAALAALASPAGEARDSAGMQRKGIDLLRLIDVEKDRVSGEWRFEGRTLVSPALPFGRLAIPYIPPAEYDLRIVAERQGGGNSLSVGLVLEGRQFLAILDGIDRDAKSGLDLVDSRPFYQNETTYLQGRVFTEFRPSVVVIAVRKKRVLVVVDGRTIIDWKADSSRVTLWAGWFMHRQDTLFLGAWTSPQRIHRLELFPVSAPGKPLR